MMQEFWDYVQQLVDTSQIVLDRPMGSRHPRFGEAEYPVSYGYLEGTTAIDSGGVDIWVGTLETKEVVGVLCSVDLFKRDTELKILYACSDAEIKSILEFVNTAQMRVIFIRRGKDWSNPSL